MAYINQFSMVCTKQRVEVFCTRFGNFGPEYEYQWQPLTSEDSFRQQVFEEMEGLRGESTSFEAQFNNIVASRWDFR